MLASGLGVVAGQLALRAFPVLDLRPLVLVAACMVMCLVPIAVTRGAHPPSPLLVPLDLKFFASRIPISLTVLLVAGNLFDRINRARLIRFNVLLLRVLASFRGAGSRFRFG